MSSLALQLPWVASVIDDKSSLKVVQVLGAWMKLNLSLRLEDQPLEGDVSCAWAMTRAFSATNIIQNTEPPASYSATFVMLPYTDLRRSLNISILLSSLPETPHAWLEE